MDYNTIKIIEFCEGKITFQELSKEVKSILIDNDIIDKSGHFTETGIHYRNAVLAKPTGKPDLGFSPGPGLGGRP
jgi:hypothetical protein